MSEFFTNIFTIFLIIFINSDKATVSQMKLKELTDLHQEKEESLHDKLHSIQKELKNALDMHAGKAAFCSVCIF